MPKEKRSKFEKNIKMKSFLMQYWLPPLYYQEVEEEDIADDKGEENGSETNHI